MLTQNSFPDKPINTMEIASYGLTKRELFAAMAMQGYLANSEALKEFPNETILAMSAVFQADRLIDALNIEVKNAQEEK